MAWPTQNKMDVPVGKTPTYVSNDHGTGNVKPGTPSPPNRGGHPAVADFNAQSVSAGKNPSSQGGVSLGTSYGTHDVAHPISGSVKNHGPGQVPGGSTA